MRRASGAWSSGDGAVVMRDASSPRFSMRRAGGAWSSSDGGDARRQLAKLLHAARRRCVVVRPRRRGGDARRQLAHIDQLRLLLSELRLVSLILALKPGCLPCAL
jgi:hypothetical protein